MTGDFFEKAGSIPATVPVFVDFEASSLSRSSWPIEIGLSWIDRSLSGHRVETASTLIKPDPSWDLQDWSAASAAVHGIPARLLETAPAAKTVARACSVLRGRVLLSDNPGFEAHWMGMLCGPAAPRFTDLHKWAGESIPGSVLDHVYERLARSRVPHRAGPDSARFPTALLRCGISQTRRSA